MEHEKYLQLEALEEIPFACKILNLQFCLSKIYYLPAFLRNFWTRFKPKTGEVLEKA